MMFVRRLSIWETRSPRHSDLLLAAGYRRKESSRRRSEAGLGHARVDWEELMNGSASHGYFATIPLSASRCVSASIALSSFRLSVAVHLLNQEVKLASRTKFHTTPKSSSTDFSILVSSSTALLVTLISK